jgi:hypothetical protein
MLHRQAAESINDLVSDFACFEDLRRALDPKDLFDTLPLLAKPVVEVRARSEVAMLQPPMRFVPGFGLLPALLIRARIFKQIGDVLPQRRLIVFDNQQVVSLQAMDLRTQRSLGMHRVQGENAPLDQVRSQQRLERADLILFLAHIAVLQDNSGVDLITTELMGRLRLRGGGSQGFAIDGQMTVIGLSAWHLEPARFVSAAVLRFPADQKGGNDGIKLVRVDPA